jgi:hypothetical protein
VLLVRQLAERPIVTHSSAGSADEGPRIAARAAPVSPGFEGCPGEGDGGDRALNRLKNRVDSAKWVPIALARVLGYDWPSTIVRRMRRDWSRRDSIAVARNEGLPAAVEGYFVGAKVEGPEATNCHGAASKLRDWHLWLSAEPGKDRRHSLVVETTPAVRARHPEWSIADIHRLVRDSARVRVSGWLMLDPEHPDQLGKTRGTLWEIHPAMRIEIWQDGAWTALARTTSGTPQ